MAERWPLAVKAGKRCVQDRHVEAVKAQLEEGAFVCQEWMWLETPWGVCDMTFNPGMCCQIMFDKPYREASELQFELVYPGAYSVHSDVDISSVRADELVQKVGQAVWDACDEEAHAGDTAIPVQVIVDPGAGLAEKLQLTQGGETPTGTHTKADDL